MVCGLLFVVIFFFKQETAYEMRISDGSSDVCSSDLDALMQCEAAIPDVVLLDWNMPVMSGMEFLEALSQREMDARPKIIFCTTENGLGHIKAAVEAGADEIGRASCRERVCQYV